MISGLHCAASAWTPSLGDPTLTGWGIAGAYGVAAVLALKAWRGPTRRFGWVLAVVLILLMLNKQLDLQSAMTAIAKCMAKAQGWYENRRPIQLGFALIVLALAIAMVSVLARAAWRRPADTGVALGGMILLSIFVAMRAAQIHRAEFWPVAEGLGPMLARAMEPLGIALIAGHAAGRLWLRKRPSTDSRA